MNLKSSKTPQNDLSLKVFFYELAFQKGQIFNKDVRAQFVKRANCYLEHEPTSSLQKLM